MSNSPKDYLKRKNTWEHVPGTADRYQGGVHHAHGQDISTMPSAEDEQETWPSVSPNEKTIEDSNVNPV